ncbi:MAG: methylated-DNA--[protein]-cysteine S-methyltransferase [Fidelibacterota bacterium]|nr:MAG: methylated-DNA--[protein]-cysteine S-methyltransferase [Candidatus Neomarinimicrobiota bacterium]
MLTYDRYRTPIGKLTIVKSDHGVCYIGLPSVGPEQVQAWAQRYFPGESLRMTPAPFEQERRELLEYVQGYRTEFTFPIDHRNTPFSQHVLKEVSQVPYGGTASYGEIAQRVGRPQAARAVGRAVATNPLALVIPCHRVVGTDGSLTGYGGGLRLKKHLLRMEAQR